MAARQYCLRLAGEAFKAAVGTFPGSNRATDDENGVVAADRTKNIGPALAIQRGGNRLRSSGHCPQYQHFADAVHPQEQLREQRIEGSSALLDIAVCNRITCTFGRGDACQAELAEVAGKRRLCHVPAALKEQLAEILLAADRP